MTVHHVTIKNCYPVPNEIINQLCGDYNMHHMNKLIMSHENKCCKKEVNMFVTLTAKSSHRKKLLAFMLSNIKTEQMCQTSKRSYSI